MRAFKFRLYPNNEQQAKLWSHANRLNKLYNDFLFERKDQYERNKVTITRQKQQADIKHMRKSDSLLKDIHSQVIQQVTFRLEIAYQSFFDGRGYPKGKHDLRKRRKPSTFRWW